ncbi:hypothetical protein ACQJBY_050412 [Aegilops geniculata]
MAPPRVQELGEMYELVEEVLIRIPPDEPADLIRASLVCKAWCGLVSGHAFRSHYRTFHKTPSILGNMDDRKKVVRASVYSSKTQEWTSPASIHIGSTGTLGASMMGRPGVLLGQALHFLIDRYEGDSCIIKYDLGSHRLSVIDLPGLCVFMRSPLLILSEDGRLVVVDLDEHGLCHMWSVEVSVDGVASWIKLREMDFWMLLPLGNTRSSDSLWLVGCVEGTDILIVATDIGAFTIDLKSLRSRKLSTVAGVMEVAKESQISQ